MIEASEAYRAAIKAQSRRTRVRAIVDLTDPDIAFGAVTGSAQTGFSKSAQLHDKVFDLTPLASLEPGRWLLDGSFQLPPDANAQVGFETSRLFGEDKARSGGFDVTMNFSGVEIVQEISVFFPNADYDGYGVDFTVSVTNGLDTYTESFTGNTQRVVKLSLGEASITFPTSITLRVTRWSLPLRRMRIPEIIPGVFEIWGNNELSEFSVNMQGNFSNMALPYNTCNLTMDNLDRRFEPRNKAGVFKSIEERQGIKTFIGVDIGSDTEYVPTGVFYQFAGGWKTGNNDITMSWDLVDIIGLLVDRKYWLPEPLPTTLDGWIASIVAQLGANFAGLYSVDANYAGLSVTADATALADVTCGQVLQWVCMATDTFPRADAETGYLTVEPFWNEGNILDLDNLEIYPTITGNDDLSGIEFTLSDGTTLTIPGTTTSSPNTASVGNPFLHTEAAARKAARMILASYGGNRIETTGRGDPTSEIGDVSTVQLDKSTATTGRLMQQNFEYSDGVLTGCKSVLLQADGSYLYQNRVYIKSSGSWTAPAGVTSIRLILVGKGANGGNGTDGSWAAAGTPGADGSGGRVWSGTATVSGGQTFNITIGDNTTFGVYSSANGTIFPNGFTDIISGDSFARPGVAAPLAGSGDGGMGGEAGRQGAMHDEAIDDPEGRPIYETVIDARPTPGGAGVSGATGCVVIYYDI